METVYNLSSLVAPTNNPSLDAAVSNGAIIIYPYSAANPDAPPDSEPGDSAVNIGIDFYFPNATVAISFSVFDNLVAKLFDGVNHTVIDLKVPAVAGRGVNPNEAIESALSEEPDLSALVINLITEFRSCIEDNVVPTMDPLTKHPPELLTTYYALLAQYSS